MINPKSDDVEAISDINGDVVFKNLDFSEKTIRQGFIRKVYGILMIQLAITLGFVSLFMFVKPIKDFVFEYGIIFALVACGVAVVTTIVLFCSTNIRRKAPANYVFLGIFTLAFSFLLGVITAACKKDEVYMALGICTVVTVGLSLFAWQTKLDFTMLHSTLFTLLVILLTVGLSAYFISHTRMVKLGIAALGAFIYALLLIYDTQLIIGGKHELAISPEEYVFAALSLYLDIISLFIRILRIIRLV